jgi:choline dehydrogenase-like flavoprotein
MTNYDAIIVGARCAGSPTAMLLARRGYRVLVVERATASPPCFAAIPTHDDLTGDCGSPKPSKRSGSVERWLSNRTGRGFGC